MAKLNRNNGIDQLEVMLCHSVISMSALHKLELGTYQFEYL